jgi:succinoglycan biosynthesis protein ExoL
MLHILYLVHDLYDPAVRRRMMMLAAGGARVTLAGFRRADKPIAEVAGIQPIDLGVTADGKFLARAATLSAAAMRLRGSLRGVDTPDLIIGRNLEMLALASRAQRLFGGSAPIVYECLDIHRLLLRDDAIGRGLRGVERALGRKASLLLTSSPAFIRAYFEPRGQFDGPVMLLENKVLALETASVELAAAPAYAAPIRIGWFGALRCHRSLALLSAFTRRMEGRFEAVLRGRPAHSEFGDFEAEVAAEPYLSFEGPYRNPEDLPTIYGEVHFTWAIDFFEAGQNSDWLLPNRLYEGCRHGVVPIAMAGTETARFLADRGIGLVLPVPTAEALEMLLSPIDAPAYAAARDAVTAQPEHSWIADTADCRALVERLQALVPDASLPVLEIAA